MNFEAFYTLMMNSPQLVHSTACLPPPYPHPHLRLQDTLIARQLFDLSAYEN